MIQKPQSIESASKELKAAINELATAAEKTGWDLYPIKLGENGTFTAKLYKQVGTVCVGFEGYLGLIPASLTYLEGVFSLKKSAK